MTVEQRSACMAKIRGKNTGPELFVLSLFQQTGFRPDTHARDLPGAPDFVVRDRRIVVFVDGDFWHGWRLPVWRHKLAPFWQKKIDANRVRDRRTHARLRRAGWRVLRIWEHQIKREPELVRLRIAALLAVAPVHSSSD
jgi:DNA mismatch endonuclease (patch repair protein)